MRPPLVRSSLLALFLALGLTACGEGDASRDDLTSMLTERAELSDDQAECVADAVFADGLFSQDQINEASKNPSEVDGFQDVVDEALATCIDNG